MVVGRGVGSFYLGICFLKSYLCLGIRVYFYVYIVSIKWISWVKTK